MTTQAPLTPGVLYSSQGEDRSIVHTVNRRNGDSQRLTAPSQGIALSYWPYENLSWDGEQLLYYDEDAEGSRASTNGDMRAITRAGDNAGAAFVVQIATGNPLVVGIASDGLNRYAIEKRIALVNGRRTITYHWIRINRDRSVTTIAPFTIGVPAGLVWNGQHFVTRVTTPFISAENPSTSIIVSINRDGSIARRQPFDLSGLNLDAPPVRLGVRDSIIRGPFLYGPHGIAWDGERYYTAIANIIEFYRYRIGTGREKTESIDLYICELNIANGVPTPLGDHTSVFDPTRRIEQMPTGLAFTPDPYIDYDLYRIPNTWQKPAGLPRDLDLFSIPNTWTAPGRPQDLDLFTFPNAWIPPSREVPDAANLDLYSIPNEWDPPAPEPTTTRPSDIPVALIEWRPFFGLTWQDVSDRLAGGGVVTQGRALSTLGGGSPQSEPSSFEGRFWSPPPEPGDQCRVTVAGRIIFEGSLAEENDLGNDIYNLTWLGKMWDMTADHPPPPPSLYIDEHAVSIFNSLSRLHGVPILTYNFDLTRYSREIGGGAAGLEALEDMTGGVTYDTPRAVVLEFPERRKTSPVARRLSDRADRRPDEFEIPTAKRRVNAFRVLNQADVILRYHAPNPDGATEVTVPLSLGKLSVPTFGPGKAEYQFAADILALPNEPVTYTWALRFAFDGTTVLTLDGGETVTVDVATGTLVIVSGTSGTGTQTISSGGQSVQATIAVTNFGIRARGGQVSLSFDYEASLISNARSINGAFDVFGEIKLASQIPLEANVFEFHEVVRNEPSIRRYKLRSKRDPIIVGQVSQVAARGFRLSPITRANMVRLGERFLRRHAAPIPVIQVTTGDPRIINHRRMSDREHLRLKDGTEGDFFVERIRTHLNPYIQTAWLIAEENAIGEKQEL